MKLLLGGKNSNTEPYNTKSRHFKKPVVIYRFIFYNPIQKLDGQIQQTLC
jgi:hypothetical protein